MNKNTCVHIPDDGLRCVTWNSRGLFGSPLSPQFSRERKHNCFTRLAKNNNIHGKREFLQAIQELAPHFRLFGTFILNNLNAGGSAICIHKDLLPEGAIVTHVVTCQSRDHIVNTQSSARNLVVVNIHFEPNLTLRNLRERLRLITPHWPPNPDALGVITGTSIFANQKKGDSTRGIRPSQMVMRRRLPSSILFFLTSSKSLSLTLQGETLQPTVLYAHCPGLTGRLSTSLWLKHVTSSAILMYSRILVNGPYRNRRVDAARTIPSWMYKHPVFCSSLKQIHDDHHYPEDPFAALAEFKVILEKTRKRTVRELPR